MTNRIRRVRLTVAERLEYLAIGDVQSTTAEHMVVAGLMVRVETKARWSRRAE